MKAPRSQFRLRGRRAPGLAHFGQDGRPAFSLTELLVVMGVLVLLVALTVPAWNHIARGMTLAGAGDLLGDAIALARQESSAKNREIRVVFFRENTENAEEPPPFRAFQVFEIAPSAEDGNATNAITRRTRLPDAVVIHEPESPLVSLVSSETEEVWEGFRFRAGGRPRDIAADANYLTLHPAGFAGDEPANFMVIQVNPVTGRVRKFQP